MKIKEVNVNKVKKLTLMDIIIISSLIAGGILAYMADTFGLLGNPITFSSDHKIVYGKTVREEVLDKVTSKYLEGKTNIEFLLNMMASHKPYLEFNYDNLYENPITSGWTTNPNRKGLTGKVRLVEPKYFGYKFIYDNGEVLKVKSPLVDNFMEIIEEYPYFDENYCSTYVSTVFNINLEDIPSLTVDNIRHHIDAAEPVIETEEIKSI